MTSLTLVDGRPEVARLSIGERAHGRLLSLLTWQQNLGNRSRGRADHLGDSQR